MNTHISSYRIVLLTLLLIATRLLGDPMLLTPEVPPEIPPGEHRLDVRWGEEGEMRTRSMIVVVPDGYDPANEHVLLYAFHQSGGSAQEMRTKRRGLVRLTNLHNMILVFPEGIERRNENSFKWNAVGGDVAYLSQLTLWFTEILSIDRRQIFVSGTSNGGGMAQNMAAWRPDMITGAVSFVASSGKTVYPDREAEEGTHLQMRFPRAPVPMVLVRGGPNDGIVPPDGRRSGGGLIRQDTVAEQFAFWMEGNECDPDQVETSQPINSITIRRAGTCGSGSVLYSVYSEILDHRWPAAGHPSQIDGDQLVIDFIRSLKPRPRPEIMDFEPMPDQTMRMVFRGMKDQAYLLETTKDLSTWDSETGSSIASNNRIIATRRTANRLRGHARHVTLLSLCRRIESLDSVCGCHRKLSFAGSDKFPVRLVLPTGFPIYEKRH